MAALVGPSPVPLSALLSDPAHSLSEQAYRPRFQHHGFVNVDGTGVIWWPDDGHGGPGAPLRYVTDKPPWADANLPGLAPRLSGRAQVAAVRSATPGMPYGPGAVGPFLYDGIAVAHNGRVEGIKGPLGRKLLDRLPDDLYARIDVLTDSVLLALTVVAELRERPDAGLAGALVATVREVERRATDAGRIALLTMLACDGHGLVGVRAAVGAPSPTLFTAARPSFALAASEPLDDQPDWAKVPDRHLVELLPGVAALTPLEQAS
jgi:glutamine amidotransferase